MSDSSGDPASRLRRELRARLRSGAEDVTLTAADAALLLDELGRLQQSNDRLRRQNRRVRKRLAAAGGDETVGDGEDGDEHDRVFDDDAAPEADET